MIEVVTLPLEEQEVLRALDAVPQLFRGKVGERIITASYEFGCNLHDDLLYRPMSVGTSWLDRFLQGSLDQRIVLPGRSDLRLTVDEERLDLLFCHESDIHLRGSDERLVAWLRSSPPFDEFEFGRSLAEED